MRTLPTAQKNHTTKPTLLKTRASVLRAAQLVPTFIIALISLAVPSFGQTFLSSFTGINGPTFVAIDANRTISGTTATWLYVSEHGDTSNNGGGRILRFNLTSGSTTPTVVAARGTADGQFIAPDAILVDASTGDLIIADRGQDRIQRITNTGTFVMKWGSGTSGAPDEMHGPVGLARDASGAIYVTEHGDIGTQTGANFVSKYTVSGTTATRVWRNAGTFQTPYGIVVSGSSLLISDGFGAKIQIWDTNGNATGSFPLAGIIPTGLYLDSAGSLWIAESSSNGTGSIQQVEKRSTAGASLGVTIGSAGTGNGQFMLPFDTVIDAATNRAYVTDYSNNRVEAFDLSTTPTPQAPAITSALTANATLGTAFTYQITGSNTPTSFSATGLTGTGLTLNTTTGAITGTPTTAGTITSTIGATNATGTGTATLTITVAATGTGAPAITSATTANATVGTAFTYQIAASNSPTSFNATGLTGTGLSVNTTTGAITGTPTTAGTITSTLSAANATGTGSATLTITVSATGAGAPAITSAKTANATVGSAFTYQITASGSPTSYNATGLTGTGLSINTTTGAITGTPTTAGTITSTISATNATGTGSATLTITVGPAASGGVHVVSVTPPIKGVYSFGQSLTFTVTFSGNVTVTGTDDDNKTGGDDGDDDHAPFFTWSAAGVTGKDASSGNVHYQSGSGTSTLTFVYKIKKDDNAPNGLLLGTAIQLPAGTAIVDASKKPLDATALKLPWTANPLTSVTIAASTTAGKGGEPVVIHIGPGLVVGEPITLPTKTESGQPITWVLVSGNATLNGNVVTPKNKGTIVLRALVAGTSVTVTTASANANGGDATFNVTDKHNDRFVNLSSRLRVVGGDGNHSVIAGFVVNGTTPKQMLIRAIGPGLTAFGIKDALANPRLQIRDAKGTIVADNSGWNNSADIANASAAVGAFKLAAGSADAAVLVTLAPGAYTAQVSVSAAAPANESGVVLVEVYDATPAKTTVSAESDDQLINISTRGFVDTGDGQLVAGFVVSGDTPKQVLIRGVGPALGAFGVNGAVADPALKVFVSGSATPIAENDDWEDQQTTDGTTAAQVAAAANATGAFPLTSHGKDAALILTLAPGSYSAVVSGAAGGTGAGLVEIYEVPRK